VADLEKLYLGLPVAFQNLALSLEGWRVARRRFDAEYRDLLAAALGRDAWSAERVLAFRDRRLADFVQEAARRVPHYRELFARERIDAREIRGLADLERLPVLRRAEVQADPSRFRAEGFPRSALTWMHTSGSTGSGLGFPATWRAHREQWAVWARYRLWHGLVEGTPCLYFGGRSVVPLRARRPPFWRRDRAGERWLFSAYHLNADTAPAYLDAMRRSGAAWIHGYPSMVALIASHALERGVELRMRWVTLGAENVLPQQEQLIERAFGVRPVQHYGMAEAVANASLCPARRLHVDEDFAALELVPDPDGCGHVVGTNFSNPAFPLLRYEVGDSAALAPDGCSCGRPGRILERLDGRLEDYVVTRSGAKLGRLDHIFKDMPNVREAQIRQTVAGRMTIALVRGARWSPADETALRAAVKQRVGDEVEFELEYVDTLPRTSREKLRFVVSNLEQGRILASRP
jgi:phenylacetate-CoA ligase